VSLDGILAYADRHAPRLAVVRERVGLGDAALTGAEPLLPDNPTVSVGVGHGWTPAGGHLEVEGAVFQRFEIGGERGRRLAAAGSYRKRLTAQLEEARWEVHRDAHAAFHRGLVARERLRVADRLVEFQRKLLDITRRRLRAGDVSPLAVRLAEGELSQSRVARVAAEQGYLQAKLELGAVAGWPPSHPPEPAGELDVPRDPPSRASLAAAARTHQPRLRTLHALQLEAEARATAAEAEAWPEPTVGVQFTREGLATGPKETHVLGVLSLPVPLAQTNQGERATARVQARIVEAQRAAFDSQLSNQIEQHRTAVAAAAVRVRTYGHEIVPNFEENLRLIQRAFELGEIDILQVSVARERFLRIQTDALDAYVDYFEAVADLEATVGTDLWPHERHEHAVGGEGT